MRIAIALCALLIASPASAAVLVDNFNHPRNELVLIVPGNIWTTDDGGLGSERLLQLVGQGEMTIDSGRLTAVNDLPPSTCCFTATVKWSATSVDFTQGRMNRAFLVRFGEIVGNWSVMVVLTDTSGKTYSASYAVTEQQTGTKLSYLYDLFQLDLSKVRVFRLQLSTNDAGASIEVEDVRAGKP